MMPAAAMRSRRMTSTTAVAGLNAYTMADHDSLSKMMRPPLSGASSTHEGGFRTVGRAGRLSVHTLDERALGMRGTADPPSCMRVHYRSPTVVT